MWSGSDRPCDDDFFQSRPDCDFRIISASGGDCRRAGLLELPKGRRVVRISSRHGPGVAERDGYTLPISIIFAWCTSQGAADCLNNAPDKQLRAISKEARKRGYYVEVSVARLLE